MDHGCCECAAAPINKRLMWMYNVFNDSCSQDQETDFWVQNHAEHTMTRAGVVPTKCDDRPLAFGSLLDAASGSGMP